VNFSPENWLKDQRGNWSFTRIAPLFCLLFALFIWSAGLWMQEFQAYCQQMVDKLLDFAKWSFIAGKGSEEFGAAFALKGKENTYTTKVETTSSTPVTEVTTTGTSKVGP
jgi:hypothetical protein